MAPNPQDGRQHHFTGAPLSRTQDLTPRAQEMLDSDLRRENELQQQDNNRWQVEAEQANQLVYNHQQQQQVPGQGADIEIVEVVVNVAPGNNGEVEAEVVDEAGPEDDPAEEAAALEDRRKKDLRNEKDRATYRKKEAKRLAKKQEMSAFMHSRRRTSRAG